MLLYSPVATLGRYFSFWAGVPNSRMPLKPMDWWAPSVMPTPRSWLPTISTSRAYCEPHRQWPIRAMPCRHPVSHPSTQPLMQPGTTPVRSVCVPECWTGRDRPGPTAPAGQRHPSPSDPPWCGPLLSPGHRFWQGRSLPDAARQRSHRNVKVKQLCPSTGNRILNYLKEFSNRPNKLAEKLFLLIIQCCQHRQLFRKVQPNSFISLEP